MGTVIIGISSTKPKHVLRFAEHTFACSLPLCLQGTKRLNRSTEICFKKSIRRFYQKKKAAFNIVPVASMGSIVPHPCNSPERSREVQAHPVLC